MTAVSLPKRTSLGFELDPDGDAFGELRCSDGLLHDGAALRARLREEGYLYLPGLLDADLALEARRHVVERLAERGLLAEGTPPLEAVARPGVRAGFMPDVLARDNPALQRLLYTGAMMDFYQRLLGGPVRHYDYTWFRSVAGGGRGTPPHCDIVYMGRGTFNLYTSWTPLGDIPLDVGGLMLLEGSHLQQDRLRKYLKRDVDAYCINRPDASAIATGAKIWQNWDGRLSSNPVTLRDHLGGRWLTTEYRLGDVLMFGMGMVHASLDNHSPRYRLSADSRYQLAADPVDERWIGPRPMAHGPAGKRGKIC